MEDTCTVTHLLSSQFLTLCNLTADLCSCEFECVTSASHENNFNSEVPVDRETMHIVEHTDN
jgi:hypothetical protein